MGLLIPIASALIAVVVLAGCYDPDLQDCTVSCAAPDDCADGQVCGDDGFCAAPAIAGTCDGTPVTAELTIRIEKRGRVVIEDPAFTCDSDDDDEVATCVTSVPRTGEIELHAIETDDEFEFERWTTSRCAGQPSTCRLTLTGAEEISVGAKFR